ncbi:hypothetical protein ACSLFT_08770 [Streptomyces sp. G6]|uniref:hypothetical protein n=1 Tax=Streptomyces sp. G6 TaxID=1178736 RepID=UPI003EDA3FA6
MASPEAEDVAPSEAADVAPSEAEDEADGHDGLGLSDGSDGEGPGGSDEECAGEGLTAGGAFTESFRSDTTAPAVPTPTIRQAPAATAASRRRCDRLPRSVMCATETGRA